MSACLAQNSGRVQPPRHPLGLFLAVVAGAISPLDYVLAGMVARSRLGFEAICNCLRLSHDSLDDALVRLGLPRPHERPLCRPHPRAWTLVETWKLIALWIAGVHPATVGVLLGRSEASVRGKSYRTGLPCRDRKLLIKDLAIAARVAVAAASGVALDCCAAGIHGPLARTGEAMSSRSRSTAGRSDRAPAARFDGEADVILLPGSARPAGSQTSKAKTVGQNVRQRPAGQLELPGHGIVAHGSDANAPIEYRKRDIPHPDAGEGTESGEIRPRKSPAIRPRHRVGGDLFWTKERIEEASMRTFAGQHPACIAEDMGVSYGAVQSILCRVDMPRRYRKAMFVPYFDRALGEANMKASGYKFDQCDETSWWFWSPKGGGVTLCRIGRRRRAKRTQGTLVDSHCCTVAYG